MTGLFRSLAVAPAPSPALADAPSAFAGLQPTLVDVSGRRGRDPSRAIAAGVAIAWIVVALTRPWVADIGIQHTSALPDGSPWFGAGILPWLSASLFAPAALVALLTPGLLATLALGGSTNLGTFALKSLGATFVIRLFVQGVFTPLVQPWTLRDFVLSEAMILVVVGTAVAARMRTGRLVALPRMDLSDRLRLGIALAIPAVLVASLFPFFFLQDLSPDGLEALQVGLSLSEAVVPRFMNATGYYGLAMGMNAMAYPVHWFALLVGPLEGAARLPLVLYAPILTLGLLTVIEQGSPRRLAPAEDVAVAGAVLAFVTVLGFNGSYAMYAMELATPAAFASLTVTLMVGAIFFLIRQEMAWFLVFALLAYFARPTGLLVLLLLGIATPIVAPERRGSWLRMLALGIAACSIGSLLFERVLIPAINDGVGPSFPSSSMLSRLQYLRFDGFERFFFVGTATGFLPLLSLPFFRNQDWVGRTVAFVAAAYLVFFYLPAFTSLHHLAPAMVLPVTVLWRKWLRSAPDPRRWGPALALLVVALWIGVPNQLPTLRHARTAAPLVSNGLGDYAGLYEQRRTAAGATGVLRAGVYTDRIEGLDMVRSVAPNLIVYYADRLAVAPDEAGLAILPSETPPPPGMRELRSGEDETLWMRDQAAVDALVARIRDTRDVRSRWYRIPPQTMHLFLGARLGNYQIDLARAPVIWRLFQ